ACSARAIVATTGSSLGGSGLTWGATGSGGGATTGFFSTAGASACGAGTVFLEFLVSQELTNSTPAVMPKAATCLKKSFIRESHAFLIYFHLTKNSPKQQLRIRYEGSSCLLSLQF